MCLTMVKCFLFYDCSYKNYYSLIGLNVTASFGSFFIGNVLCVFSQSAHKLLVKIKIIVTLLTDG